MDVIAAPRRDLPAAGAIDVRALSKLRWRCRRGLLENDLLLERFFTRAEPVSEEEARGLALLMELADNDLLDLADIFKAEPRTPIGDLAFLDMARRNISL